MLMSNKEVVLWAASPGVPRRGTPVCVANDKRFVMRCIKLRVTSPKLCVAWVFLGVLTAQGWV